MKTNEQYGWSELEPIVVTYSDCTSSSVQIEDTHVASLFPISVFGERSLMLGGGASASCVAVNGPCIVGSLSRAAFNHAVGNELGQELEDFTRLRAIVQDAKNEQNYQVAHQSEHEKLMMSAMAMLRKILRKKIGRMRAVHAKKTAKAKYHWSFVKDFAMALILVNIPCLFDLTSRHYSVLGRRIRHTIKKHKMDEVLYNKGDASLGIYILFQVFLLYSVCRLIRYMNILNITALHFFYADIQIMNFSQNKCY